MSFFCDLRCQLSLCVLNGNKGRRTKSTYVTPCIKQGDTEAMRNTHETTIMILQRAKMAKILTYAIR